MYEPELGCWICDGSVGGDTKRWSVEGEPCFLCWSTCDASLHVQALGPCGRNPSRPWDGITRKPEHHPNVGEGWCSAVSC